jgi:hypothetical protein
MSRLRTILPSTKWYQYYINPFELIGLPDKYSSIDNIDSNQIKKLKKLLLQEIELEDGKITWMPNLTIDKAKALNVCNELHDKNFLEFHLNVFNNKPLLNFLSRGDCTCFDVDLENTFLVFKQQNKTFNANTVLILINQFNLVVAEAIKTKQFTTINQLFNCRHWVPSSKLHLLTKSTSSIINKNIKHLEKILDKTKYQAIHWRMLSKILYQNSLFNIINELPQDLFWEQQEKTLELLNYIAVALANKDNFTVAVQILEVAQQFSFKSKKYDKLITENLQIIINKRFAKDNKTTIPHNNHNNTKFKDPTVTTINKHLKSLEKILNKAEHQVIHWRMISKVLHQNLLLVTINELPQDLFVEQKDKVLSLLNAIAITVANKDNFTLAAQILEAAQQFNFKSKKYDALIAKNLQIVTKKCFAKNNKTIISHNKHNNSNQFKKFTIKNNQKNTKQNTKKNTKKEDPYSDNYSTTNKWFYLPIIILIFAFLSLFFV